MQPKTARFFPRFPFFSYF